MPNQAISTAISPAVIVLLLAFGASQLVWGLLSERFGRRPILLIGLSAWTLVQKYGEPHAA